MQYVVILSESGNDLIDGPFNTKEKAVQWANQRQGETKLEELMPPVVKEFVVFLSKDVTVEMKVNVSACSESEAKKLAIQSAESVESEQLALDEQSDFLEKDWSVESIDENAQNHARDPNQAFN